MNTCKTALRILKSRKMYLVIYLGFIGIMMVRHQLADHAWLDDGWR